MATPDYYGVDYLCDLLKYERQGLEAILRRYEVPPRLAGKLLEEVALELIYKGERIADPNRWMISMLRRKCRRSWIGRRHLVWGAADRLYSTSP